MTRLVFAVFAISLMVPACAASSSPDEAQVDLSEFAVDVSSNRLAAGSVTLSIANNGEFPHTLVISEEDGTVIAGTELIAPGAASNLTLDLSSGGLVFTCRIVTEIANGEIVDHYERGMAVRVEVVDGA